MVYYFHIAVIFSYDSYIDMCNKISTSHYEVLMTDYYIYDLSLSRNNVVHCIYIYDVIIS